MTQRRQFCAWPSHFFSSRHIRTRKTFFFLIRRRDRLLLLLPTTTKKKEFSLLLPMHGTFHIGGAGERCWPTELVGGDAPAGPGTPRFPRLRSIDSGEKPTWSGMIPVSSFLTLPAGWLLNRPATPASVDISSSCSAHTPSAIHRSRSSSNTMAALPSRRLKFCPAVQIIS